MQTVSQGEFHRVDGKAMLPDLRKLAKTLQDDLRERSQALPAVHQRLTEEHREATQQGRTAATFAQWREDYLTQVAVAWVLGCVFLRYLEDNELIDRVWLAGAGERATRARDTHQAFFRLNPTLTEREYLEEVFRSLQSLPGCQDVFGPGNPLWLLGPSGDAARALVDFWQQVESGTGRLLRAFGPDVAGSRGTDTRFLGDLYQDLSEDAKKRYALLQTPEFVEEFILDHTLTPALAEFGLEDTTLLDPACGSGHFLLGAFQRLFSAWRSRRPGDPPAESARRALEAVFGVDLNPFAVAIARFRLLIAALQAAELPRLAAAPANFKVHVVSGDSLLHGGRLVTRADGSKAYATEGFLATEWAPEPFARGDYEEACRVLSRGYAVVVGNPPYITDKDKAHNEATRARYPESCYRKFALAAPFTERFFELAAPAGRGRPAGYVGMLTTNAFMKREYGKKLIETILPQYDLTHVIDTSGAYIPGCGTPTVILLGRHQTPVRDQVRAVMGIRGEPSTPEDPAQGQVWRSIVTLLERVGSSNQFVSVSDVPRETFQRHPWSIGGGGAAELKELLESNAAQRLCDATAIVGVFGMTNADDVYLINPKNFARWEIPEALRRPILVGDDIRDWSAEPACQVFFPYTATELIPLEELGFRVRNWLWFYRTVLGNRATFGKGTYFSDGHPWWKWHLTCLERLRAPLSIAFAFVSTHNHFVLDRGGKVFNRTAPVIKLPAGATEDDHLALLGVLNSSTFGFWSQQTLFNKGGPGGGSSKDEKWHDFFEHDGGKLLGTPLPEGYQAVLPYAQRLDELARQRAAILSSTSPPRTSEEAERLALQDLNLWRTMVFVQEELDWFVLTLFGLASAELAPKRDLAANTGLQPGERAFEIRLARQVESGQLVTRWFERPERPAVAQIPRDWDRTYRELVERRIGAVESDPNLALVESMNCKRRWELEPWDTRLSAVLKEWLLNRLESPAYWPELTLTSCARLAERARKDPDFMQVAELYAGRDVDLTTLVSELATGEAVPFLAAYRYTESGLRKRADWEATWDLQRREDAGEKVGSITVPTKYASADFAQGSFWRLRGKLDVPKERFLSYPHAEREADPTPVLGWAGWNHLQQAQALATCYLERKEQEGWTPERLAPLLAGLVELLPWLRQWHNDVDPDTGERLGDFYAAFADSEARQLGTTVEQLRAWRAPEKAKGRGKRKP